MMTLPAMNTTNGGCGFRAGVYNDIACNQPDAYGTTSYNWIEGVTDGACF